MSNNIEEVNDINVGNIEEDIKIVEELKMFLTEINREPRYTVEQSAEALNNILNKCKKNQKIVDKIELTINKLQSELSLENMCVFYNVPRYRETDYREYQIEILCEILKEK